jgi:hypothetical protein
MQPLSLQPLPLQPPPRIKDAENIRPLRFGHTAESLTLSPRAAAQRLHQAREQFHAAAADAQLDDPLGPYVKFIRSLRRLAPTESRTEVCELIVAACARFETVSLYANDRRFISLWRDYADFAADPPAVFRRACAAGIAKFSVPFHFAHVRSLLDANQPRAALVAAAAAVEAVHASDKAEVSSALHRLTEELAAKGVSATAYVPSTAWMPAGATRLTGTRQQTRPRALSAPANAFPLPPPIRNTSTVFHVDADFDDDLSGISPVTSALAGMPTTDVFGGAENAFPVRPLSARPTAALAARLRARSVAPHRPKLALLHDSESLSFSRPPVTPPHVIKKDGKRTTRLVATAAFVPFGECSLDEARLLALGFGTCPPSPP